MEIRRVDPELIPPTVASDRGARVHADRRQQDPQQQSGKRDHRDADAETIDALDTEGEPTAHDAMCYNPEGQVEALNQQQTAQHSIDFTA